MPDAQAAILPPALRETGLLATLFGSAKKIWQATEKTWGSRKPSSKGARKPGSTRMSLLSSTTMSFRAARKPALEPPPKPRLRGSASSVTCGNAARTNSALPSVEPLLDYHDFVIGIAGQGFDHRGEVLLQQGFSVPVGDDDRRGRPGRACPAPTGICRGEACLARPRSENAPQHIRQQQRHKTDGHPERATATVAGERGPNVLAEHVKRA